MSKEGNTVTDSKPVTENHSRRRRTSSSRAAPPASAVEEVTPARRPVRNRLMVAGDPEGTVLLWRALEALSWQRRWLVWVAPPRRPSAREIQERGLDLRHQLIIHLRPGDDPLPLVERALASGHCSAVLAWPSAVSKAQQARLEQAAQQGQTLALLCPPLASGQRLAQPRSRPAVPRRRVAATAEPDPPYQASLIDGPSG